MFEPKNGTCIPEKDCLCEKAPTHISKYTDASTISELKRVCFSKYAVNELDCVSVQLHALHCRKVLIFFSFSEILVFLASHTMILFDLYEIYSG